MKYKIEIIKNYNVIKASFWTYKGLINYLLTCGFNPNKDFKWTTITKGKKEIKINYNLYF